VWHRLLTTLEILELDSHHSDLASSELRLEQSGGVHGAVGVAGAHHRVDLVNEQNHLACICVEGVGSGWLVLRFLVGVSFFSFFSSYNSHHES